MMPLPMIAISRGCLVWRSCSDTFRAMFDEAVMEFDVGTEDAIVDGEDGDDLDGCLRALRK